MSNESVPSDSYLHKLKRLGFINGQRLWQSTDGDYYTWDGLHGEIEWYTHTGRHKGSLDAITGYLKKVAVKGRKINVK